MAGRDVGEEDDDYMGDLSLFLPSELSSSSSSSKKKSISKEQPLPYPSKPKRRPKGFNWQEQRRLDRERMQREEDDRTIARLEAPIPDSNVGFKLLRQMGYDPGSALGKAGTGRSEPVGLEIRRSRAGIGAESARDKAVREERDTEERKRRREEEMMAEFGSWRRTQWRSRRVFGDYKKAEAALAQLENREVVEPAEDDGDEKEKKEGEEDEEEVITEEDLHDILMKLRDQHCYCLYCGCQYESAEALAVDCPGPNEDDH
ncbi:uncharacterized protein [Typha angustifolia]|uniref:uncharacterized protein n=1 Tax=Typha angustifolia TaxID=59011 RepID=UPI003C303078